MRFAMHNLFGCNQADFEIMEGRPTMLHGLNESGKTSVMRGLQALLTGDTNPYKKTATGNYLFRGADKGEAVLVGDDWSLKWDGKVGDVEIAGDAPAFIHRELLNQSYLAMKGRAAASVWQDFLGAVVPIEDLQKRMSSILVAAGFPDLQVEKIVFEISSLVNGPGWDSAVEVCADRAKTGKEKWGKEVASTGERRQWGSKIGETWKPQGWTVDCEGLTQAEAMHQVTELSSRIEEERKGAYLSESQSERRVELFRRKLELEEKLEALSAALQGGHDKRTQEKLAYEANQKHIRAYRDWKSERELAKSKVPVLSEEIGKLRMAEADVALGDSSQLVECPWCSRPLVMKLGTIEKPQSLVGKKDDLTKALRDLSLCEAAIAVEEPENVEAMSQPTEMRDLPEYKEGMQVKGQLEMVKKDLAEFPSGPTLLGEAPDQSGVEEELARANERLAAVTAHRKAKDAHDEVTTWLNMKGVLDKDGIRGEVFGKKADHFNHLAASMAGRAGDSWSVIELDPKKWRLNVGDLDVAECSRSEQWRAILTATVVVSLMEKASMVLIDDVDTLVGVQMDGDTLFGFLNIVKAVSAVAKIPVVMAVARPTPEEEDLEDDWTKDFNVVWMVRGDQQDLQHTGA